MSNYQAPSYNISITSERIYKVDVFVNDGQINEKVLTEEAEKNPLFAVALVQKIASKGDPTALQIQAIYQGYHQYVNYQDKKSLEKVSNEIITNASSEDLAINFAKYLVCLLNNQKSLDSSVVNAGILLNKLVPCFEQTLTMPSLKKSYEEQEIRIPEMTMPYNALPDLIKYREEYYVAFREGRDHVAYGDYGKIRILRGNFSSTFKEWIWENVALLEKENLDLRDPHFFINNNDQLQLVMGSSIISVIDGQTKTTQMIPYVAFFKDDKWEVIEAIVDHSANGPVGQWIWRVTWNTYDNKGYALSYGKGSSLSLVKTYDGLHFERVTDIFFENLTNLTEGTLRFKADGTVIALIRTPSNGIIGVSTSQNEYKNWSTHTVPFKIGGPNFLLSQNEQKMWAGNRHFFLNEDNTFDKATIVYLMDEKSLIPCLRLRSCLDNSYPGMVLEKDGSITIVYYSSPSRFESNIYITNVKTR